MKIVQNGPKAFKNVEGRGRPNTFLCLVITTVIPRDSCKMQYESLPETEQRQKHLRAHGKVFADTSEEKEGVNLGQGLLCFNELNIHI